MEEQKIIERWGLFYNFPCHDIQTKNGLLFLVANFCLIYIFGMENIGNCTSEKNDERESLPKARNAGVACCVWKYKSGNHAYTLLGEGTNACFLLNFKNRKINALSNDITFNVDDMTDVINGRIRLRKLQEVIKLLVDDLFTPVLHLSRAVFDLHTNSNGQFDIPPSVENADLQSLHQYFFRRCMESGRYLGQLRRAPDGNSGVTSRTPGGYSGMCLNPHSASKSHYAKCIEDIISRFLTPGGYDEMLVKPTHLANSQYSGGFERIPGSSPTPTLGWGEMKSYRPFLTNPKPLGGAAETVGRFANEIDLPEAKRQCRNSKDSDQFRPPEGLESSFSGSLGRTADMSFSPGSYDRLLSHPPDLTNPTPIIDPGYSDSGQFRSIEASASSSFVCVRGSEEFSSLGRDGKMLSYPNDFTNPKPLGDAAETVGRFTYELYLPEAKWQP